MTGLAVHALHYGLLVAGLLTVAVLVLTVRRGRRDGHDEHDERVRRLRDAVSSGAPSDEDPGGSGPPFAG